MESQRVATVAAVHLDSGDARHEQTIRVGRHTVTSDEPVADGGGDAGPGPYGLVMAGLAACTSITLRMYADRKGWELGAVHVDLVLVRDPGPERVERVERTIRLAASVTAEQRARLAEIADKTPVTRTLKRAMAIDTTFT